MLSGHTEVFTQAPSAALRPWIKRFLVVTSALQHQDSHLPDTGLVAAFQCRGECLLDGRQPAPRAGLTGLWDRSRHHTHSRGNTVVLAAFTPLGAAAFFRHPLDELANATVDLEGLLGGASPLARLEQQLADSSDPAQRVSFVEQFLLARVQPTTPDPLVVAAVAWLERCSPSARIDTLVRYIGLSQSALERRFRHQVGASPKRFQSIVRLQKIVQLQARGANLTASAQAAGYFDQSHFIRDFKRVTGRAPAAYFRAR
jgi:AraC-like DNA-binding protein